MSAPEHDELIQRELDGVNTPVDSARLEALAKASPDVKARLETQRRVAEAMLQAKRLDPPARMAQEVMAAVRRKPAAPRPSAAGKPVWFRTAGPSFTPRFAAALAFALVVGVGLGMVVQKPPALSGADTGALSGTSLSGRRLKETQAGERQSFTRDGVRADATTRIEGALLVADIRIESARPVEVALLGLEPRGFSVDGAAGGDVVLGARQVRFTHPAGRRRYTISFEAGNPPRPGLNLRLGDGEGSVFPLDPKGS